MVVVNSGDTATAEYSGIDVLVVAGRNQIEMSGSLICERVGFMTDLTIETTAGEQANVVADCPFDSCCYGVCWDPDQKCLTDCVECTNLDYVDFENPLDLPENKMLVYGTGADPPNNWEEAFRTPTIDVSVDSGVPSNVCPGDFVSIDFTLSHDHPVAEPTVGVKVRNELTGEVDDKGQETISKDFDSTFFSSFDIPSDVDRGEQTVATIIIEVPSDVNVDPAGSIELTSVVGNSDGSLTIESVQAPDNACPQQKAELEVVGKNTGDCNEEAIVRVTDPAGNVTETESSSIFSGSTATFRPTVVMPDSGGDFTVELVRA